MIPTLHTTLSVKGHRPLVGNLDCHDVLRGGNKLTVCREAGHLRIVQITLDDGPQAVELVATGCMALHPVGCE